MTHRAYEHWLQLLVYGELDPDQHSELNQHLATCDQCRSELEKLKKLHSLLLQSSPKQPDDTLLNDARQELRASLRIEHTRSSFWTGIRDWIQQIAVPQYKIALGGLATLAAGVTIGYFLVPPKSPTSEAGSVPVPGADVRITNVRFLDSDASDGQVEFSFDTIKPMRLRGNLSDERVQKVLAHAMLNEQNPGVRLRAVSTVSAPLSIAHDREIKAALIIALTTDDNPGVRKEALLALRHFPFDQEIKNAFLTVLMNDENAGLRIAAINSLDSSATAGEPFSQIVLDVLKDKMKTDNNNYIRIRAKAVIEEAARQ